MNFEFRCDFSAWLIGFSVSQNHVCINLLCLSWMWDSFGEGSVEA